MNFQPLTGLVAAPFTAFHSDGSLNLETVERQAESLAEHGVSGAFVCGTTGEGASLSVAERKQLAERWTAAAGSTLRIVIHAGTNVLSDSIELAAHAQKVGAAAVGIIAPHFFKPATVADLIEWCAPIAAAAPELPFYYYHMPAMTGVALPCAEFLAVAAERIPNLAGVKFTHENLMDYLACVELQGRRFDALFGRDEILLAALALGARGAIGSTYNYAAPIFVRLLQAFEFGNLEAAREEQVRANAVITAMVRHGGLAAGKAIMAMIGLPCGPMRLPMRTLEHDQITALRRDLEACGFFELCAAG